MYQRAASEMTPAEISLSWVLVDGEPRQVSEFAAIAPRRRPDAVCPQCDRRLTLKLGNRRRHHAAHRPGDRCLATRPESALHLDCKFALAAALRSAAGPDARVTFRQACRGAPGERCDRMLATTWAEPWDDVKVEHRLDHARRPDILLLRKGKPVGAVEILASHAVTDEKANVLAATGLPWVEIDADPARRRTSDWNVDEPVDARRVNAVQHWRCAVHAGEIAMRRSAQMTVREPSPDEYLHSTSLRAARVVDLYHPSGQHERFIYKIVDARTVKLDTIRRLLRGNLVVAEVRDDDPGNPVRADASLRLAFREDVTRLRGDSGAFIDSPMQWARDGVAEFITQEAMFDRQPRDPTVLATTYPRRWFFSSRFDRWFLPDDMRDVRWDRADDDPLGAHPAWRRPDESRATRPAPEGSWSTLIFARRLTAGAVRLQAKMHVGVAGVAPGIVRIDVPVGEKRRTLFLIERATDDAVIESLITDTTRDGARVDHLLWLSHPRDWRPALEPCAWAAAGCDSRGRGAIVIDRTGVYHIDAFLRAVASRDASTLPANVRSAMADRVTRLRQRRHEHAHEHEHEHEPHEALSSL
jgi:hypothetical protein